MLFNDAALINYMCYMSLNKTRRQSWKETWKEVDVAYLNLLPRQSLEEAEENHENPDRVTDNPAETETYWIKICSVTLHQPEMESRLWTSELWRCVVLKVVTNISVGLSYQISLKSFDYFDRWNVEGRSKNI